MSSGNSWGEQLGGNKPPAQGPGPGGPGLNGDDSGVGGGGGGVPNNALQRQLQLQHMMQQVSFAAQLIFKIKKMADNVKFLNLWTHF